MSGRSVLWLVAVTSTKYAELKKLPLPNPPEKNAVWPFTRIIRVALDGTSD